MQKNQRLIICAVSILAVLVVPYAYANVNATGLVTDSRGIELLYAIIA